MDVKQAAQIAKEAYGNTEFNIKDNILSFAGSDDIIDWIKDIEAFEIREFKEYPGLVHAGFATDLDALWPKIQLPPVGEIYIIGHSLGGALATLASVRLQKMGYIPIVYTFGSPRVGNYFFNKAYKIVNYRWVNKMDIVPHVPPILGGYEHVGDLNYIGIDGKLEKELGEYLIDLLHYRFNTIKDHYIDNYITSINGLGEI